MSARLRSRQRRFLLVHAAVGSLVLVLGMAVLAQAPVSRQNDPNLRLKYDGIFGGKERAVVATAATRDDVQLANELLTAAGSLKDDPDLVAFVYERAFDLAAKDVDGYTTALSAAEKLKEAVADKSDPSAEAAVNNNILALHRNQYRRAKGQQKREAGEKLLESAEADADRLVESHQYAEAIEQYEEAQTIATALRMPEAQDLKSKLKRATDRRMSLDKIEKLKAQAGATPDAARAKQLVDAYLLDLDQPAGAAEFAVASGDAAIGKMLPLAATPIERLKEPELLQLGMWYVQLAEDAQAARKAVALERAQSYFADFLRRHTTQDAERLQATARLDQTVQALGALPGAGASGDRLVLWNQYNGSAARDRGTDAVTITLLARNSPMWSKRGVKVPWAPGQDTSVVVRLPRVSYDAVRVEIVAWHQAGGGLSEIELYRGSKNVALKAPARASGSFPGTAGPAALTDGITTSKDFLKGYWILPDKSAGWAEVSVSSR